MRTAPIAAALTLLTSAAAANITGVNFGSGPDTQGWTTLVGLTSHSEPNLTDELGNPTSIDFSCSSPVNGAGQTTGSTFDPGFIPTHTQDLSGLDGYMWGVDTLNARFDDLDPRAGYEVFVIAHRGITPYGNLVTIRGSDDDTPVVFTQQSDADNALSVNGEPGSSARSLSSYAVTQRADENGNIYITINDFPDQTFGIWAVAAIGIRPVPAPSSLGLLTLALAAAAKRRR